VFQVQVVSRFSKFHAMMAGGWPASICRGCLSVSMKLINFQSFYFVWTASICRGCLSVSMKLINFQSFYFVWMASICRGCLSVSMKLINFQSFYLCVELPSYICVFTLSAQFCFFLHLFAYVLYCSTDDRKNVVICLHLFCTTVLF